MSGTDHLPTNVTVTPDSAANTHESGHEHVLPDVCAYCLGRSDERATIHATWQPVLSSTNRRAYWEGRADQAAGHAPPRHYREDRT